MTLTRRSYLATFGNLEPQGMQRNRCPGQRGSRFPLMPALTSTPTRCGSCNGGHAHSTPHSKAILILRVFRHMPFDFEGALSFLYLSASVLRVGIPQNPVRLPLGLLNCPGRRFSSPSYKQLAFRSRLGLWGQPAGFRGLFCEGEPLQKGIRAVHFKRGRFWGGCPLILNTCTKVTQDRRKTKGKKKAQGTVLVGHPRAILSDVFSNIRTYRNEYIASGANKQD